MAELSYVATLMAGSPDIRQPRQGLGVLGTLFRLILNGAVPEQPGGYRNER